MSDYETLRGDPPKYSSSFWSKNDKISGLRKKYIKTMVISCIATILLLWCALPFYWGSLWKENEASPRLKAWVVNLDTPDSLLSSSLATAVQASNAGPVPHLGWEIVDRSYFTGADFGGSAREEITHRVVEEEAWIAVVVNENADANLLTARQNGDTNYNGSSAINVYTNTGRNNEAYSLVISPQINSVVQGACTTASANSAASYLAAQAGNTTAINLLASAPATISGGYAFMEEDLRPYSTPVAVAVTLVGLIYLLILAFIQTIAGAGARAPLEPYLTTKSLILVRLAAPFLSYLPLSLFYTMVDLPFKVPFGAKFSFGAGFVLWWVFVYLGMLALGLATEAVVTLVGPPGMPYMLVAWIIINVAEAFIPIELSYNVIYRIGYGLPFWNLGDAVRAIIFRTKNRLGRNAGVLIAWIVFSMITTSLFVFLMQRKGKKEAEKEKAEGKGE